MQSINKNQADKLISTVRTALDAKLHLMRSVSIVSERLANKQTEDKYNLPYSAQNQNFLEVLERIQSRLLIKMKENIITLTMLGFFAQKEDFVPQVSQIMEEENGKCWNKLLKVISECAKEITNEFDSSSVLFHIELGPQALISRGARSSISGKTSETINFTDVFLKENQFMIISKRENIYMHHGYSFWFLYGKKVIRNQKALSRRIRNILQQVKEEEKKIFTRLCRRWEKMH